jgi:hypothetical protein
LGQCYVTVFSFHSFDCYCCCWHYCCCYYCWRRYCENCLYHPPWRQRLFKIYSYRRVVELSLDSSLRLLRLDRRLMMTDFPVVDCRLQLADFFDSPLFVYVASVGRMLQLGMDGVELRLSASCQKKFGVMDFWSFGEPRQSGKWWICETNRELPKLIELERALQLNPKQHGRYKNSLTR